MSKNTSIALNDRHMAYAQQKVVSGEFGSISEVIRDALRRAEEYDARIAHFRTLIREGEDSGPPQPFDFDEFLLEMRDRSQDIA